MIKIRTVLSLLFISFRNIIGSLLSVISGPRTDYTCIISNDGALKCWGQNGSGQLGLEDQIDRLEPPITNVDLGDDFELIQISMGDRHNCVLSLNNKIKCFGINNHGQLGIETTSTEGNSPNEMGNDLAYVNLGADFIPVKVYSGRTFNCALSNASTVKCWGDNSDGQLGLGDTDKRGNRTNTMGDFLPVLQLGRLRPMKS